jgi:hypothetical protein
MNRRTFTVALAGLLAGGCRQQPDRVSQRAMAAVTLKPRSMKTDLVFVTRDGCVNTPDMLNNLDDALRALGLGLDYPVVNLATLPPTDPRSGYPTPTVLVRNRGLFGMPEPTPPFPEPS